jgi:hypothetical protein
MITSQSFDYDNIISRRACSYTINSIITNKSFTYKFISKSQKPFFFACSMSKWKIQLIVFLLPSSISSISPFQFPDMSSRVDCFIYLIINVLRSSSWQMTKKKIVPLDDHSFNIKENEWRIKTKPQETMSCFHTLFLWMCLFNIDSWSKKTQCYNGTISFYIIML